MRTYRPIGIIAALALAGCLTAAATAEGGAGTSAAGAVGAGADWPHHGAADDESGFSRLDRIDAANVERLGLAWALDLPGEATLEATPITVDGRLYVTGSYSVVYCVDAQTGRLLWKHDPQVWRNVTKLRAHYPINRGAAYADGRIFSGTLDGRLIALDAVTGKLAWDVQTVPLDSIHTVTGAPRTFGGKVIIGNAGADYGMRGYVTAYDQRTGKQLWRFHTVPGSPEDNRGDPAMEMAAKTWGGEYWKTGTGGTVWNGMTFDPELNRIYIGTGNGGPYDPEVRSPGGGDNLFLASIVALDADTGKYVWHYQVNPREGWDYKATANMIMAELTIDGRRRKVLMQAPTNGFFYVLDREAGKLISAEKIGKVTWAERIDLATGRPVEAAGIRYENSETVMFPGVLGGHNWQAMTYSPATGLVYIPYLQMGQRFTVDRSKTSPGGHPSFAMTTALEEGEDGTGALIAWDPIRQQARWRVARPTIWNGGTLATAGNLVFQGTADGAFAAYDARDGRPLWQFDAGLGIIAAPSTYLVGGRQYVSVLVGFGGSGSLWGDVLKLGWKYGAQPRRLLTFRLDGKASLPPSAPPDRLIRAVDDPAIALDPADVAAGAALYPMCVSCHGFDLHAAGAPGPDLRESPVPLDAEAFWSVVHDGALLERGMPSYDFLTREQARQLRAYIRAGARAVISEQRRPGAE